VYAGVLDQVYQLLRETGRNRVRFARVGSGIANQARIFCGQTGQLLATFGNSGAGWCDVDCAIVSAEIRFYVEAWGGDVLVNNETPNP
jgi:hypothetical protein